MSSRGQGYTFRPTYTDRKGEKKQGKIWWVGYSHNAEKIRESTGFTEHRAAVRFLNDRLQQIGRNKPSPKAIESVTFADLEAAALGHSKRNQLRSVSRFEVAFRALAKSFAGWRAIDISADAIRQHQERRLAQGRQPATINWEVSALRQAFRLLKGRGLDIPDMKSLAVDNTRRGFVSESELQRLLVELPPVHQGWTEFLFVTGWRVSEAFSRKWADVDFEHGFVVLHPGQTKNKKGRRFPLIPRIERILEAQLERKKRIELQRNTIVEWVFMFDDGSQIRRPERCWASATRRAGLEGTLRHDLRRSAVMSMERAGLARTTAMALSGHDSDSVFRRYAIQSEVMLREGGAKLQALHDTAPDRKVIPITR